MSFKKVILFAAGVAVLGVLVAFPGFDRVLASAAGIGIGELLLLYILQSLTLLAGAWMWHFLVERKAPISFGRVFLINQASGLVESLTPSVKLGGEAAKVFLLRQHTGQSFQSITGVLILHKFLTMAPFVLLGVFIVIPALYMLDLPPAFYAAPFVLLVTLAGLAALCYSGGNKRLKNFFASGKQGAWFKKVFCFAGQAGQSAKTLLTLRQTAGMLGLSLLIWAFYPVKVYLVCIFLGLEASFAVIVFATLGAYIVSMVPLLPGGLGTYEGTMALVFALGGLAPAEGLAVSLVSRSVTFWFPLVVSAAACMLLAGKVSFSNRITNL